MECISSLSSHHYLMCSALHIDKLGRYYKYQHTHHLNIVDSPYNLNLHCNLIIIIMKDYKINVFTILTYIFHIEVYACLFGMLDHYYM